MIDLRPYDKLDGPNLAARLHAVSRQELDAVGMAVDDLPAWLEKENERGAVTSGWIDDKLAFVGCSIVYEGTTRASSFLFAAGFDTRIAIGLRKWAQAEAKRHPEATKGIVYTYSAHPQMERLFSIIGLKRTGQSGKAAVFELS